MDVLHSSAQSILLKGRSAGALCWASKVRKVASNEVDLTARYSSKQTADGAQVYFVNGATLCEVKYRVLHQLADLGWVD